MFHPCDVFPEEVWVHHIFDKLTPETLLSLSDAHPFWSTLLERKRPGVLMQLCLPIITGLKNSSNQGLRFDQPRPPLIVLPHADLLNIRLVCKACNQGVQQYFQNYSDDDKLFIKEKDLRMADFFNENMNWRLPWRNLVRGPEVLVIETRGSFRPHTPRVIGTWLDSIETKHFPSANPILSRKAIFNILDSATVELEQEALDMVTRCLRAHGKHLLRCTFALKLQEPHTLERHYSLLLEWLQPVPNLAILQVDFCRDLYGLEGMTELETRIQNNPLPELPRLSKLTIRRLPPPLLMAVLKRYQRLEILELEFANCPEVAFSPVHMENLITLIVQVKNRAQLTAVRQLFTESWLRHLQKLEIYFCGSQNNPSNTLEWRDVFAFLNNNFSKAEKLDKLHLMLPFDNNITHEKSSKLLMDTQEFRLRFPHVEQMKLIAGHVFQLDFLLPMRHSLKKLAIFSCDVGVNGSDGEYPPNTAVKCHQNILWNGWLDKRLLKSNIWEAFPNLDFIRVQKIKGWAYRKRHGTPVIIHPDGTEEGTEVEKPIVDWDELANRSGDHKAAK